jgi:hypothetical protein
MLTLSLFSLLPVAVLPAAIPPALKVSGFPPDNGTLDWNGEVNLS